MLGKLRNKLKNKKGFTMVELIIVIVIILILGAALVPQLTKYIDRANQANCKSDAATILTQLQVDYIDYLAHPTDAEFNPRNLGEAKLVSTYSTDTIKNATSKTYSYKTATSGSESEITDFGYSNGTYYITWTKGSWSEPTKKGEAASTSTSTQGGTAVTPTDKTPTEGGGSNDGEGSGSGS